MFGSKVGRWTPGAKIEKLPSRFAAAEIWNGHNKLGQAVAYEAMDTCMKLADKFGVGMVSVDNATHYLWGGGYVMDAALKGYLGERQRNDRARADRREGAPLRTRASAATAVPADPAPTALSRSSR